ncbi:MAG: amino acid racemase [Clostridia bacterium]|nr:amino acid racemase [Clostridia bacterium]
MIDGAKALGVLGGMGPMATQLFFRMVVDMTDASCDQEHLNMIIFNHATMPDRTKAILSGETEEVYKRLLSGARFLADAGADVIAIPCNTSHYFIDRLKDDVKSIEFIDMIRETARFAAMQGKKEKPARVGILATEGTLGSGLYQKRLAEAGAEPVILSDEGRRLTMKIIYDCVKSGIPAEREDVLAIEKELSEKGCSCAVMGCTELSCLKEDMKLSDFYIDAMKVLAEKSVMACDKRLR